MPRRGRRRRPRAVERLKAAIRAGGVKLFAVIDHSAEAAVAGLELRDTKLLVFGSPQAGTAVMAARPLAALDLPLKLLVWDDAGRTSASYVPPSALAARYGLTDALAGRLGGVEAVTSAVLGRGIRRARLSRDGPMRLAVDILPRLAVIGWEGVSEPSCAPCAG
jgi:uncharacterized protein (DUF302 family)